MSKNFNVHDPFFKKAKAQGYRARSVYKLDAIQQKFHLIQKGDKVLDIGAAPGSFLQLISKLVGQSGLVVGIDLQPIKPFEAPNIHTVECDVFDPSLKNILAEKGWSKFDVVTSDLAPKTSGIKSMDAGRSVQLNMAVLDVAEELLKPGGHIILKFFPGADQQELLSRTKNLFNKVSIFTPPAVRRTSSEKYVVGIKKK